MNRFLAVAVGAVALIAPLSASALVADFTDTVAWPDPITSPESLLIGDVTVTVEGIPTLRGDEALPVPPPTFPFAGSNLAAGRDGFGAGAGTFDDETERAESITVTFSKAVYVTAVAFLDLFASGTGTERAKVEYFDAFNTSLGFQTFDSLGTPFGYLASSTDFSLTAISKLVFTAPNDPAFYDDGNNDFALAALEFTTVPLPAPALMLIGALGGFAFLRRRQTA